MGRWHRAGFLWPYHAGNAIFHHSSAQEASGPLRHGRHLLFPSLSGLCPADRCYQPPCGAGDREPRDYYRLSAFVAVLGNNQWHAGARCHAGRGGRIRLAQTITDSLRCMAAQSLAIGVNSGAACAYPHVDHRLLQRHARGSLAVGARCIILATHRAPGASHTPLAPGQTAVDGDRSCRGAGQLLDLDLKTNSARRIELSAWPVRLAQPRPLTFCNAGTPIFHCFRTT